MVSHEGISQWEDFIGNFYHEASESCTQNKVVLTPANMGNELLPNIGQR